MCASQGPADDWSLGVYNTLVEHFSKPLAGIVANYDYDGILCAAMLKHAFPKSHIFGFYDLRRIARMPIATWRMLGKAIWLDCAIDSADILCIDQHLVDVDDNSAYAQWNDNSFNPNGHIGNTSLNGKYPFSCSQLIYSVLVRHHNFSWPTGIRRRETYMLSHADSAWKMPFRYPQNCNNWIETFHASERTYFDALTNAFNSRYNSPAYSTYVTLREYMDDNYLLSSGGNAISGQLKGYQDLPPWWRGFAGGSTFQDRLKLRGTNSRSVQNCWNHISRQFNWRLGRLDNISEVIEVGPKCREFTRDINGNLGDWILGEDVFSHVIPKNGEISYTPGRREILRRITG